MFRKKDNKDKLPPMPPTVDVYDEEAEEKPSVSRRRAIGGLLNILSFFLAMMLTVTMLLCMFHATIFNETFFREQIEKSGYVENLMDEVQETLTSYGMASGFSSEFFENVVSRDMLEADIYREISRVYSNSEKFIDTRRFNEQMKAELTAYVKSNLSDPDAVIGLEQQNALDYLADTATEAYVSIVSIPFTEQIYSVIRQLSNMSLVRLAVLIALDVILIIAILLSGKDVVSKKRRIESLMNAIAASVLVLGVPMLIVIASGYIKRISLSGRALYFLLQQFFESIMLTTGVILGIMLLFWLCGLLYRQLYLQARRHGKRFSL
ncbi:MAG: hypothetical protein LBQ68_09920 [Clostridiales bacterium]|jgi:hypothetical protein|nr:hypothetical protein [Clostridiales bacterium]